MTNQPDELEEIKALGMYKWIEDEWGEVQPILVEEVKALITRQNKLYCKGVLEGLKNDLPTKFSPDGAGGWHTPTYELAVEDFKSDIDAAIQAQEVNKQW